MVRPERADPALDHAWVVSDDADTAPRACGDAGGAADGLYPVRPGAWAEQSDDPFRACTEEHAGAGDHHHRVAVRRPRRVLPGDRDRVSMARHGIAAGA